MVVIVAVLTVVVLVVVAVFLFLAVVVVVVRVAFVLVIVVVVVVEVVVVASISSHSHCRRHMVGHVTRLKLSMGPIRGPYSLYPRHVRASMLPIKETKYSYNAFQMTSQKSI